MHLSLNHVSLFSFVKSTPISLSNTNIMAELVMQNVEFSRMRDSSPVLANRTSRNAGPNKISQLVLSIRKNAFFRPFIIVICSKKLS